MERSTNKYVSDYLQIIMTKLHFTQDAIGVRLNRSHAYVSVRLNNIKSWTLNDLDGIAGLLGLRDGLELIAKATILIDPRNQPDYLSVREEDVMRSIRHGMLGLAADRDGNKLREATEDYS
ncbi:hypothetical protein A200_07984 [Parascardovia denticolens IPLA 20019]|nr:hypothetical protein A200_07984 [Parascardovia denticolens IPLA 20019]